MDVPEIMAPASQHLLSDILSVNSTDGQSLFLMGFLKWQSKEVDEARLYLRQAKSFFFRDMNQPQQGEGATKTGNAMLSQDRFCDGYEKVIETLQHKQSFESMRDTYEQFDREIRHLIAGLNISVR